MTSKIKEIRTVYKGLQTLYNAYLPKVDPNLVDDLLTRQQQKPPYVAPFYMVEIFTKLGTNPEVMRDIIIETASMVPAFYHKGTHYVANQRLTLEMLEEISDYQNIVEVTGEYTDGVTGRGASHEHMDMHDYY